MKITLIDRNTDIVMAWEKYFHGIEGVEIVNTTLNDYLNKYLHEIDAIVSPANSFGLMDGGYDRAIILYFGRELQDTVQQYIRENYHGEQVVGTAFSVNIPNSEKMLIHAPSMRVPSIIRDSSVVYSCMRATLLEAQAKEVKSILVPAFGGLTGRVPPDIIAHNMFEAYCQINTPVLEKVTWDSILHRDNKRIWETE